MVKRPSEILCLLPRAFVWFSFLIWKSDEKTTPVEFQAWIANAIIQSVSWLKSDIFVFDSIFSTKKKKKNEKFECTQQMSEMVGKVLYVVNFRWGKNKKKTLKWTTKYRFSYFLLPFVAHCTSLIGFVDSSICVETQSPATC